jgi:hypothetical protein
MRNAIASTWPEAKVYPCVSHLRANVETILRKGGLWDRRRLLVQLLRDDSVFNDAAKYRQFRLAALRYLRSDRSKLNDKQLEAILKLRRWIDANEAAIARSLVEQHWPVSVGAFERALRVTSRTPSTTAERTSRTCSGSDIFSCSRNCTRWATRTSATGRCCSARTILLTKVNRRRAGQSTTPHSGRGKDAATVIRHGAHQRSMRANTASVPRTVPRTRRRDIRTPARAAHRDVPIGWSVPVRDLPMLL